MDIEINDMFSEKHQKLFANKLRLDLERNSDALCLSTTNIVKIEIAKLFSSLKRIYTKYSMKIDNEKVKELLSETKDTLLEETGIIISEKEKNNGTFIDENEGTEINKKYLRKYHERIDDSEKRFDSNIELCIKEHIDFNLYNKLLNTYCCKNEEMQNELFCQLNVEFASTLIKRIITESKYRNETLKNMAKESYDYYLDLSSSTKGNGQNKKIKK